MTENRYRIYTEHVNLHQIQSIVDKYFKGYSMFTGMGVWDREHERCLVIEIVSDKSKEDVIVICRKINRINHQKCCLVTAEKIDTMYVGEKA